MRRGLCGIIVLMTVLSAGASGLAASNDSVIIKILPHGTNIDNGSNHFNIPRITLKKTCAEVLALVGAGMQYSVVSKTLGVGQSIQDHGISTAGWQNVRYVTYYCTDGCVILRLDYDDDKIVRVVRGSNEMGRARIGPAGGQGP